MRIFFIGPNAINFADSEVDLMEAHVTNTLRSMGHDVFYFPYLSFLLGYKLNRFIEFLRTDKHWFSLTPVDTILLKKIESYCPDMILTLLGNYTSPVLMNRIRKNFNIPLVCWCQDHMGTMGRQYIIGAKYDYIFAKDMAMVELFRRYTSLPSINYLAEACNPLIHKIVSPTEVEQNKYECDVTTAGSLYYFRSEIFESIQEFKIKFWGTYLPYYTGPLNRVFTGHMVTGHQKAACFNASKIVLNTLYPLEINGLNARAFETAGCGGFQLISNCPAVNRHFNPGVDIETFENLNELKEKINYYLMNDEKRKLIASKASEKAHREDTYEIRLNAMLNIVFNN